MTERGRFLYKKVEANEKFHKNRTTKYVDTEKKHAENSQRYYENRNLVRNRLKRLNGRKTEYAESNKPVKDGAGLDSPLKANYTKVDKELDKLKVLRVSEQELIDELMKKEELEKNEKLKKTHYPQNRFSYVAKGKNQNVFSKRDDEKTLKKEREVVKKPFQRESFKPMFSKKPKPDYVTEKERNPKSYHFVPNYKYDPGRFKWVAPNVKKEKLVEQKQQNGLQNKLPEDKCRKADTCEGNDEGFTEEDFEAMDCIESFQKEEEERKELCKSVDEESLKETFNIEGETGESKINECNLQDSSVDKSNNQIQLTDSKLQKQSMQEDPSQVKKIGQETPENTSKLQEGNDVLPVNNIVPQKEIQQNVQQTTKKRLKLEDIFKEMLGVKCDPVTEHKPWQNCQNEGTRGKEADGVAAQKKPHLRSIVMVADLEKELMRGLNISANTKGCLNADVNLESTHGEDSKDIKSECTLSGSSNKEKDAKEETQISLESDSGIDLAKEKSLIHKEGEKVKKAETINNHKEKDVQEDEEENGEEKKEEKGNEKEQEHIGDLAVGQSTEIVSGEVTRPSNPAESDGNDTESIKNDDDCDDTTFTETGESESSLSDSSEYSLTDDSSASQSYSGDDDLSETNEKDCTSSSENLSDSREGCSLNKKRRRSLKKRSNTHVVDKNNLDDKTKNFLPQNSVQRRETTPIRKIHYLPSRGRNCKKLYNWKTNQIEELNRGRRKTSGYTAPNTNVRLPVKDISTVPKKESPAKKTTAKVESASVHRCDNKTQDKKSESEDRILADEVARLDEEIRNNLVNVPTFADVIKTPQMTSEKSMMSAKEEEKCDNKAILQLPDDKQEIEEEEEEEEQEDKEDEEEDEHKIQTNNKAIRTPNNTPNNLSHDGDRLKEIYEETLRVIDRNDRPPEDNVEGNGAKHAGLCRVYEPRPKKQDFKNDVKRDVLLMETLTVQGGEDGVTDRVGQSYGMFQSHWSPVEEEVAWWSDLSGNIEYEELLLLNERPVPKSLCDSTVCKKDCYFGSGKQLYLHSPRQHGKDSSK
ncbi:glutamic acid-rich protein-like [Hydractinia symbiolongicarpus]|uniref:glutamic acid-rich protein-like n=1 Tax=Hydractinia symbiolongicarpus TaxID=13093 RepID=UPI00254D282E|nr:glutamic acid-rich protein-like [Hydractinia symbiolongicarpus]